MIFNGHHFPYDQKISERSRELRKNVTPMEAKIWYKILKGKNFKNLRFLRQKPIGHYIVDFYCAELKLVIEIDGGQHYERASREYDQIRNECLSRGC